MNKLRMWLRIRRNKFFWWRKLARNRMSMQFHRFMLIHWYDVPRESIETMEEAWNDPEVKAEVRKIALAIMDKHMKGDKE